MKIKNIISLLIILILVFFIESFVFGKISGEFLALDISPRASGLGGAYTSICDDITALHYNPAILAKMKMHNIYFSYFDWFADIKSTYLAIGNVGEKIVSGFSIYYLSSPSIEVIKEGIKTGEKIEFYDLSLTGGIGLNMFKDISSGISVKYINRKLENWNGNGITLDFGLYYSTGSLLNFLKKKAIKNFNIGILIGNIGGEFSVGKLPSIFRIGISCLPIDYLLYAFEIEKISERNVEYKNGVEFPNLKYITPRMGILVSKEKFDFFTGISLNFNLENFNLRVDYSLNPLYTIELSQNFSLLLMWFPEKKIIKEEKVVNTLPNEKILIAVLNLTSTNILPEKTAIITEMFRVELINLGLFKIIEQSEINNFLNDQQILECKDIRCACEIGKILKVEKVIIGEIYNLFERKIIIAKVINVKRGEIEAGGSISYEKEEEIGEAVKNLANLICNMIKKY